ncbi:MAG: hypothetical protein IT381_23830 [Deltaproteobacteria bacterium]|nr:hypothetical protein [Deltaproteobacteria bacterium]
MFTLRAEQLDPEVAADPTQYLADFEHLFESLGEERFVAFVHVGEARGRRQLHIYRDELALRGDDKSRALFDAVVADEAHHEAYTGAILATLSTKPRAAIARARRWELWRAWLRAGRLVSAAVFTWTMRLLYLCLFPLALYEKRRAR